MKLARIARSRCLVFLACVAVSASAAALESDQFYAWGKPIEDSTEYLNAWVKWQVQTALDSRSDSGTAAQLISMKRPEFCRAA